MEVPKFDDKVYQTGYSEYFAKYQYDETIQDQKAQKALSILKDYYGSENGLKDLDLLDIGCSAGLMTRIYSREFRRTVGIDIDQPAVEHAGRSFSDEKLTFRVADAMETNLPAESFDVVTCTHIYEHVPEATRLIREIYRLLRPKGICYFVAQNRITLIEPHYFLPFLSMLPKPLAHAYFRLFKKGDYYYENLMTLGRLRRLVADFEIVDYTEKVIANPERFYATEMISPGSFKQALALKILELAYFLCPTYVWLLRKP
jgi:2-polyprenyl-3-methyl-5-hydroxy-6-metoxy-1,4-benzoquinol methylase